MTSGDSTVSKPDSVARELRSIRPLSSLLDDGVGGGDVGDRHPGNAGRDRCFGRGARLPHAFIGPRIAFADGRRLRVLTVTDEASKACLAVVARRNLRAVDGNRTLVRSMTVHVPPARVHSDNAPEFIAQGMRQHLAAAGVRTMFIEPGAPWQYPCVGTLHARLRDGR